MWLITFLLSHGDSITRFPQKTSRTTSCWEEILSWEFSLPALLFSSIPLVSASYIGKLFDSYRLLESRSKTVLIMGWKATREGTMATIELTSEKISRLRHVNREDLKPGRYEFPDFLLIGPQRTGTSWLHENLCFHPQIFMPSKKELYFFNKLITKQGANYTSDRFEWYSAKFTPRFRDILRQNAVHVKNSRSFRSLNLNLNKLFSPCLKGEATASYAVMKESLIEEITIFNPDIKAIMLIRNPLERAWSHAKKDLLRRTKKELKDVSIEEFKQFYSKDYQMRCGGYSEIIRKWGRIIGKENLFVGIYDDIGNRPDDLLRKIFSFLGVSDNREHVNSRLSTVVINKTKKEAIPEMHRDFLLGLFNEELEELNRLFKMRWS